MNRTLWIVGEAPAVGHGTLPQRAQCLLGLIAFVMLAFIIGRLRNPRAPFPWRAVTWGLALQFIFGLIVLYIPNLLYAVQLAIQALLDFTKTGARVVFGNLIDNAIPVTTTADPGTKAIAYAQSGAIFAFFVLPTIIFFSALTAIAYHSGL